MARAFRLILCLAALLWLVFVVRLSRDVEVGPSSALGPLPGPRVPQAIRPANALDEGAAGQEMQRLRDHWQRAVLLR
jgi:hypothetical protein